MSRVLRVGRGKVFELPSQAAAVAKDGDIIEIASGRYVGDVAVWRANNLTICGVKGRAHIEAAGKSAQGKAIWVITGHNTTVENIEFSGCHVPDRNGAGIRQEGAGLTVRNCHFHHNDDGILAGANPSSDILIETSEFGYNGAGDGLSHNIYIGHIRRFTLRGCYSHHSNIGHQVKSRAEGNRIMYNRLTDEADGRSSYNLDLPNGGDCLVIGNVIQHGRKSANSTNISYASEGSTNRIQKLLLINNTIVNEQPDGAYLKVDGSPLVQMTNNLCTGTLTELPKLGEMRGNIVTQSPGFVDEAVCDYHMKAGSPARKAGVDPGKALYPEFQYRHPASLVRRRYTRTPDVGAFQM
ncbi:MAG: right-handed parallel beta-helix repeat-containing protein [Armatimonadota bacterium]